MSSSEQIPECKNLNLYWDRYAFIKFKNDFLNGMQERISYEILDKIKSIDMNTTIDHIKKTQRQPKRKTQRQSDTRS
jgi:hypothetical protein